jgi:D-alanine-D-alanine ligase-like ATP-grasp enzyme
MICFQNSIFRRYDTTQSQPSEDVTPLYSYAIAPAETQTNLQQLAVRAFQACAGRSYGRVDIRTRSVDDTDGHTACVLEVNSQPGLSFEANTSSAAELLRLSRIEPTAFVIALIVNALSLHHQHDVELV